MIFLIVVGMAVAWLCLGPFTAESERAYDAMKRISSETRADDIPYEDVDDGDEDEDGGGGYGGDGEEGEEVGKGRRRN